MKPLTAAQVAAEHNKALYERNELRWEFMRRSTQYRRSHRKALKLRQASGCPPEIELTVIDHEYFHTQEWKQEQKLCRKYDLTTRILPDPAKSYTDLFGKPPTIKCNGITHSIVDLIRQKNLFDMQPRYVSHKVQNNELLIKIDLSQVNSIDNLKHYISEIIAVEYKRQKPGSSFQNNVTHSVNQDVITVRIQKIATLTSLQEHVSAILGAEYDRKPRKSTYKTKSLAAYLKAGILHDQGLTGKALLEALEPGSTIYGVNPDKLRTIRRHVVRYHSLINGEWEKIQFP